MSSHGHRGGASRLRPRRIVIAGFGAAAWSCIHELRAQEWDGELIVLAQETHPPYDRPPLAKAYLKGSLSTEQLRLGDDASIEALAADIRWGTTAVGLDVARGEVRDDHGSTHPYDALVVATGVRPRRIPGVDGGVVQELRTLDDAQRLRAALEDSRHLVVVGGGLLGLEVAASARSLDVEVTVIEPAPHLLARRLETPIASRLLDLHRAHGVRVLAARGVDEVRPGIDCVLRLDDGTKVHADSVLVAIGAIPDVAWLTDSGLTLRDVIVCDAWSRAAPECSPPGMSPAGTTSASDATYASSTA